MTAFLNEHHLLSKVYSKEFFYVRSFKSVVYMGRPSQVPVEDDSEVTDLFRASVVCVVWRVKLPGT